MIKKILYIFIVLVALCGVANASGIYGSGGGTGTFTGGTVTGASTFEELVTLEKGFTIPTQGDGNNYWSFLNNTSVTPGSGTNRLYFVGNVFKAEMNGVAYTVATTTGPLNFDDVDGSATGNLSAANVSRTLVNSYGRSGAVTLTLPAAAEGMTFIALVGTQHNSAWKIQRNGSDTITWSANGTDTPGKTYFQETNQAVGSRVSCITYRSGASAYTWLCGATTGTWVTD